MEHRATFQCYRSTFTRFLTMSSASLTLIIFMVAFVVTGFFPTQASGAVANVTKLIGRNGAFCALIESTDGLLRCWGYGASGSTIGETHDGEFGGFMRTPAPLPGLRDFSVRAGADNVCAITDQLIVTCRYPDAPSTGIKGGIYKHDFRGMYSANRTLTRIECGSQTCCVALKDYGLYGNTFQSKIYCWSFYEDTYFVQSYDLPQGFPDNNFLFVSLAQEGITDLSVASPGLACATTTLSRVLCWGYIIASWPNPPLVEINTFQALSTHVFDPSYSDPGPALMAFIDADATVVHLGVIIKTYYPDPPASPAWSALDFTAVPGFGSAIKQVAITRRTICALSTSSRLSCANHVEATSTSDGSYLGLGLASRTYLINVAGPIDLGHAVLVSSFALVSNAPNRDPSDTVCTLDTLGQVRCFGSNAFGALGAGLPSSIIIGDEPGEMGQAIKPLNFFGCGAGRYEFEAPATPAPAPFVAPVEPQCVISSGYTITQSSGVFVRNRWVFSSLDRDWSFPQSSSISGSAWCTEYDGLSTSNVGVFNFRPSVSGLYTISATTQIFNNQGPDWIDGKSIQGRTTLTPMPILVSQCSGGFSVVPMKCYDEPFGRMALTLALYANQTYFIEVRYFTNFLPAWSNTQRMNFTISSTLDFRAPADYTWPFGKRTFAFEGDTALQSPEQHGSLLSTTFGDFDPTLLSASAYFTPAMTGWYYFGCLGTGASVAYPKLFWFLDIYPSRDIPTSSVRRKFVARHDGQGSWREEEQESPIFMLEGKEYVVQYAQYGITGLRRGLSTQCWYTLDVVTKPLPALTCASCIKGITPGGQNVYVNYTAGGSVTGSGRCVETQVTMWHSSWAYHIVTSFASQVRIPLFLQSAGPIYVALSHSYTPAWLASADISAWTYYATNTGGEAMPLSVEGRLFKGGRARLEVVIRVSRLDPTVTDLDIPIAWWPLAQANLIRPGSDENKYILSARVPIEVKPQVSVSPSTFRYVLDEGVTYDAQTLSPPLEFTLTTETNDAETDDFGPPLDTSDSRSLVTFDAIVGCDSEAEPDDFRSSDFITWSTPTRSKHGYGNLELDLSLKPDSGRATLRAIKLGYVPPIDKSTITSCYQLHLYQGNPNSFRFHNCLDFYKGGTYLTSYLYSGAPRSSLGFTVEEPWLLYAPQYNGVRTSPLYLFRVGETTEASVITLDPSYRVNVRYIWDLSLLPGIYAVDPVQADLTDVQKYIPVGRCINLTSDGTACYSGINFTAMAGQAYFLEISGLPPSGSPPLLPVGTLYKIASTRTQQRVDPFTARRRTHCVTLKTTLNRIKQGVVVANFSFSSQVTIDVILRRPCPRGSYSISGTNEDTCSPCSINTYQDSTGQSGCIPCPINRPFTRDPGATSLSRCLTPPGQFVVNGTVSACLRGSNCSTEGVDILDLVLLPGFWRTGASSLDIRKCLRAKYCVGGAFPHSSSLTDDEGSRRRLEQDNVSSPLCYPNHGGPLCESCTPFTSKQGVDQLCLPCTDDAVSKDTGRIAGTLVGVAIAIIIAAWLVLFACGKAVPSSTRAPEPGAVQDEERLEKGLGPGTKGQSQASKEVFHTFSKAFVKIRVLISLFQVIGSISIPFTIYLPEFFEGLARLYSLFTLDLALLFDFGCTVDTSQRFYVSLVASSVMPLLVALTILVLHGLMVECRARKLSPEELVHRRNVVVTLMFLLMFVVYPAVSQTILSTFNCMEFDDGSQVIATAPAVSCLTDEYFRYRGFAIFMVVLYVVGIPVLQTVILFLNRDVIRDAIKVENARVATAAAGSTNVASDLTRTHTAVDADKDGIADRAEALRFLWGPYKSNWFFWEIWEMIRKLLQTSILTFVASGTSLQVVYLLVVTIVAITVVAWFAPYRQSSNTFLSMMALWIIFFVTFIVLLVQLEPEVSTVESKQVFDADALNQILIALVFFGPALVVVQVLDEFGVLKALFTRAVAVLFALRSATLTACTGDRVQESNPSSTSYFQRLFQRKKPSAVAEGETGVVAGTGFYAESSNGGRQ